MFNNPYEDYMRNSLGFNMNPPMMNMNANEEIYENNFTYNQINLNNIYPEIYRVIYPVICRICANINENITEELINKITNDVYINIENLDSNNKRNITKFNEVNKNIRSDANNKNNYNYINDTRQENRTSYTSLLKDLIRILILRELVDKPNKTQIRPLHRQQLGTRPRNPYIL